MDLGRAPAKSEAFSEMNLRDDIVEALDELLSELETSTGNLMRSLTLRWVLR